MYSAPLKMQIGKLDRRVTLLEPRRTRGTKRGEVIEEQPVEHRVWAARRDFTGREKFKAGVEFNERQARFVIRWRRDVRAGWTLVDERGARYAIEGMAETGRRRYLEILAVSSGSQQEEKGRLRGEESGDVSTLDESQSKA